MTKKTHIPFNADTPEAAAYRYEQGQVHADIEGMARAPELEALHDQWVKDGVPHEERIRRLVVRAKADNPNQDIAAE